MCTHIWRFSKTMRKSIDMCTKLPSDASDERLRWVLPIANKEIKLAEAAKLFYGGQRTLERWVSNYRKHGEAGLTPKSTRPKTQPNETSIRVKERIIELRKETKLCAQKLNYKLKKENVKVSDQFDLFCAKNNILHYLIDPGKPAQNGKVERSHRTDQEMFYDRRNIKTILGLKRAIKQWNERYNNLEHCALKGKTPNEMLLIN